MRPNTGIAGRFGVFFFAFMGVDYCKKRIFVELIIREESVMTTERPIAMREYALRYGTYMGLFWIIKFTFIPLGFSVPLLQLLFIICTLFVPVLGFLLVRHYRKTYNKEESFTFGNAFCFTAFMYAAAILLTAVAHYVYFRYIDGGYILTTYRQLLEEMGKSYKEIDPNLITRTLESLDMLTSFSTLQLVFQLISQNVFYCFLLALPTAFFTMKRKI